ncbi:MAG: HupE/UreJ family protein [Candidatus Peregrinibacteria bacterium]|nr:HupE/UreJ family protein [Candidatus Peregrinibacteria bacterium]
MKLTKTALVLSLLTQITYAHQIGGNGVASGLTHPFGLDHLLAMIAVGIISTQIGGKAVWKVPATFVSFMIIGGIFGILNFALPVAETGIALSVLFLGTAITLSKKIPMKWVLTSTAFFAIFHGQAHGAEMPQITHPTLYILGFVTTTTLLHILGVTIGHYAKKTNLTSILLKYSGAGIGFAGLFFLLGL